MEFGRRPPKLFGIRSVKEKRKLYRIQMQITALISNQMTPNEENSNFEKF